MCVSVPIVRLLVFVPSTGRVCGRNQTGGKVGKFTAGWITARPGK